MNSEGTKILVIDDEPNLSGLMKIILTKNGYEVFVADSGEEGLKLAECVRPALIVLDINMPELDGWETLTALKSSAPLSDIPVIMCSVYCMGQDRLKSFQLGAVGYLLKPYIPAKVTEEIERALGKRAC